MTPDMEAMKAGRRSDLTLTLVLLLPALAFLLGGATSCGYIPAALSVALARGGKGGGGGTNSTADRSQPLVPAVSNLGGGVISPSVNLWSGNLFLTYPILEVPATGPDWDLALHYNSILAAEPTTLGLGGWRHSLDVVLLVGDPDPNSITVRWGDGRRDVFVSDGNGWAGPPALHGMRIVQVAGGHELRDKHVIIRGFDAMHRLSRGRDRNGNEMTFSYDGQERLVRVTDATGRSCAFTYDGQGRLISIAGLGLQPVATFEYGNAQLIRVRDAAGNPTEFGYDASSRLISATDPEGDAFAFEYQLPPPLPVISRVTTTGGAERRFTYDAAGLRTSVTDVVGGGEESIAIYAFDADGRCIGVTAGPLGTTQNVYDAANNLISHTDAGGHTTTWTYSTAGDLLSVTHPGGGGRSYAYDPTYHLLTGMTDEAGNSMTGQRDMNGNLSAWTDPLGSQNLFAYDARGRMVRHTDRIGNTTNYAYDADGNLSSVSDPLQATISIAYNPRGRPLSITDQEGLATVLAYDVLDRPINLTLPGGEMYSAAWTAAGMLASITDPRGAVLAFAYNDQKQLIARTDPLGFTLNLIRNGVGRVTRVINELGNATNYNRDLAGRITAIQDPDGGMVSFVRGCCDILSRADALGSLNYQYSARHQRTAVQATDGSVSINYAYDARSLLVQAARTAVSSPTIAYHFGYDAAGRLVSIQSPHLMRTTTLALDAEGNPTLVQTADSPPLGYSYDGLNRVASVATGTPPLAATVAYTPRGLVQQLQYANGTTVANYQYDANGRLTQVQHQASGFSAVYGVGYDAASNRVAFTSNLPGIFGSSSLAVTYDLAGKPIRLQPTPGGMTTIAYTGAGDRSQLVGPGGTIAYAHTAAQRMIQAGQTSLLWNAAGGCIQVTRPTGVMSFEYHADGALRAITQQSQTGRLHVGPLGEIAAVDLPGGGQRWFAYDMSDRGLLRREIKPAPGTAPIGSYVFAPGLAGRGQAPSPVGASAAPVMWNAGSLPGPPPNSVSHTTLADPSGTITVVGTSSGNLVFARAYDLFGDITNQTPGPHEAQGFLGMEAVEGWIEPLLLGLSASSAGAAPHDPLAAGVTSLHPYLPETGSFLYDASSGSNGLFNSTFVAMPSDVRFRPPRVTPRPSIAGSQNATVGAAEGEEITTDRYGRVKIQFHWDRETKLDEGGSCWVRASQGWAGGQWGGVAVSRIGQEVIVDFLEGDPDRPLVIGNIYKGGDPPPYLLGGMPLPLSFSARERTCQ